MAVTLHSGAGSSQLLESCGRPRALTQGEQSPVRYKVAPKRKLVLIGFSHPVWQSIPAEAQHKRMMNSVTFSSTSRVFCDTEADGAVRWSHVLRIKDNAGRTRNWNNENLDWRAQSFYRQTQNGVLCGPKRNDYLHSRICKATVIVLDLFSLKQIPLNWKEHTFHTGSSSNQKISLWAWSTGSRIRFLSHETSLIFHSCESARIVFATANDRLERPSWWTKKSAVQAKQSSKRISGVSAKVAATLLFRKTICWQAHWTKVVTFAGEVLFNRTPLTSIKPEATFGERIDLRISGQPEVLHTQHEKAENISSFQNVQLKNDIFRPSTQMASTDKIQKFENQFIGRSHSFFAKPLSRHATNWWSWGCQKYWRSPYLNVFDRKTNTRLRESWFQDCKRTRECPDRKFEENHSRRKAQSLKRSLTGRQTASDFIRLLQNQWRHWSHVELQRFFNGPIAERQRWSFRRKVGGSIISSHWQTYWQRHLLENLYKMQVEKSEELKYLLRVYVLETTLNDKTYDYCSLELMAQRHLEQKIKDSQFKARNRDEERPATELRSKEKRTEKAKQMPKPTPGEETAFAVLRVAMVHFGDLCAVKHGQRLTLIKNNSQAHAARVHH